MNTPKLYDPTPAELPALRFDPVTRSFHSLGRIVLDLRGVTLTNRVQVPQDTADADCLGIWRNLMAHDLRLARQIADQKRRRLFLTVAPYSTHVEMERDGARFMLGYWPSEESARKFVTAVEAIYNEQHIPLRVDL